MWKLAVLWSLIFICGCCFSLLFNYNTIDLLGFLAGAENYFMPIAIAGVMLPFADRVIVHHADLTLPASRTLGLLVVLLSFNVVLMCMQFRYDMSTFFRLFDGGIAYAVEGTATTAERALRMGRATGIFASPAQHGLAYSIGLSCALYLVVAEDRARRRAIWTLCLIAIGIGGFFSASKVYLLLGLPASVLFLLACMFRGSPVIQRRGLEVVALFGLAAAVGIGLWRPGRDVEVEDIWGYRHIHRTLIDSDRSLVNLTGNRYGSPDTPLRIFMAQIADANLLFGTGFNSVPFTDSQFVDVFAASGLFGLAALGAFVIYLVICVFSLRGVGSLQAWLLYVVLGVVLMAMFGLPSFTTNRASTIVWVIVFMFLPAARCGQADGVSRG